MEQPIIANGGLQNVPQIAVQYVYLDFDGELTSYNGEILTIDEVEVKNSSLTEERIAYIVAELNAKYAAQNVIFVTEKPQNIEYSTIYIGKTSAFDPYGSFAGVAETIDTDNQNKTDNAFVNLDSSATDAEIITTIAHETDHLLGTLNHGGEGIEKYADDDKDPGYIYYYLKNNETLTGGARNVGYVLQHYPSSRTITSSRYQSDGGDDYVCVGTRYNSAQNYTQAGRGMLYISSGGVANKTTINGGVLYISSGGVANETTINYARGVFILSCGVANETTINSGAMCIDSGGVANETTINSGAMWIDPGGVANETTINSGGTLYISSGGIANNTTINSGGHFNIWYQLGEHAAFITEMESGAITGIATYLCGSGTITIKSAGVADSTTLQSGGRMIINSGGVAKNTTIYSGGEVNGWIQAGENAAFITEIKNGEVTGTATHLCAASGSITIGNGGTANSTMLSGYPYYRAQMTLKSGGVANETTINSRGDLRISSGGVANETTINAGGSMYISSGGVANETTINSRGYLCISSGGVANETTINSGGSVYISSGGAANEIILSSGGGFILGSNRGELPLLLP